MKESSREKRRMVRRFDMGGIHEGMDSVVIFASEILLRRKDKR